MSDNLYPSLDDFLNKARKKPKTKKTQNTKFKKVMKEFGKGKLKPYHADEPLKSKKQDGSEAERKQAVAIAFSEAGLGSKKKKKKLIKEDLCEYRLNDFFKFELLEWLDGIFYKDGLIDDKKEYIINFIDKHGLTLEGFKEILLDYLDVSDVEIKDKIDYIIGVIDDNFDVDECVNETFDINEDASDDANEKIHDKAYHLTMKLIDNNLRNLRYTDVYIPGIIGIFPNYGIEIDQDSIDGFKEAIEDFLAEELGFEPTFADDKAYDYWQNLSVETYKHPVHNLFEDI